MQHQGLETFLVIGRLLGAILAISAIPAYVLIARAIRGKPVGRALLLAVPLWLAFAPVVGRLASRSIHANHSTALELTHSPMASAPLGFLYVANAAIVAALLWLALAISRRGAMP